MVENFVLQDTIRAWNGVISGRIFSKNGLGEKVATLDCRQSSDKVDDFVQYVIGLAENKQ